MEKYAYCYQGLATSDNARFLRGFWEHAQDARGWEYLQFAPQESVAVSGCSHVLYWQDGRGEYYRHAMSLKRAGRLGGWKSGAEAWGKSGIAINRMGDLPTAIYQGTFFDCNVAVVVPYQAEHLLPIWAYCSSPDYSSRVREINQKLSVTNLTLTKVPFDLEHWQQVADEKYPDGLPEPYSEDPTQWIFEGTVTPSEAPLQVAVARLLGYRWPEQADDGLDDLIDDDGIVCIPAVRGEQPAASRLQQLLARAHGDDWKSGLTETLLAEVGYQGKTLDDWLRDGSFQQHCELFHQRPFIWHIWDGRKRDGFHALVNYHQLDRRRLETLTYTYLGDWIRRQQEELKQDKGGAEGRLEAAKDLQSRLALILEGETPYDIFVRWKPIEEQPIGWEPD